MALTKWLPWKFIIQRAAKAYNLDWVWPYWIVKPYWLTHGLTFMPLRRMRWTAVPYLSGISLKFFRHPGK